jgi:D-alanine-D-alanine ligase
MADAGVPTPRYRVLRSGSESSDGLRFPLVVKPRQESTSFGLQLVQDPGQLAVAVEAVRASYQQDALVEEYIEGREICVGLLGNETLQFLPFVEHEFGAASVRMLTWEAKTGKLAADVRKICPAPVSEALAAGLRAISEATFRACWCRDYARVDIRIDVNGAPYVLEINSMASLGSTGSFVLAASAAGYPLDELVNRILDIAHSRYFGGPAPRRLEETYMPPRPQHVLRGRHLQEAVAGEARSSVPAHRNAG